MVLISLSLSFFFLAVDMFLLSSAQIIALGIPQIFFLPRMYRIKSIGLGMQRKKEPSNTHCWWDCILVQPLWKTVWRFLKKLRLDLPYDPAIPLLGIYSKDLKTHIQKDICTPMFIAALVTVARTWKQPKCPKIDDWLKKLWYIYTMEYYSCLLYTSPSPRDRQKSRMPSSA